MNAELSPDWSAIEQDYLAGKRTIAEICKRHHVSRSALAYQRKKRGWPGRYKERREGQTSLRGPLRGHLIARLFSVLESQIKKLEMQDMENTIADKEVALLGNLSRTLEKLVELDAKQTGSTGKEHKSNPEMLALRDKISKRISQLAKG